jgi:hypothetical protein
MVKKLTFVLIFTAIIAEGGFAQDDVWWAVSRSSEIH